MALNSPRFKSNARLQKVENNNPPMRVGEHGQAVRLIQQSLVELGYPMPVSFKRYGTPDGIYGKETRATVVRFQQSQGLSDDGVVGTNTMGALDRLFLNAPPTIPPAPAAIRYMVPGIRVALNQLPNNNVCWAVGYAIMRCWRDAVSHDIAALLGEVGPWYVARYNANLGLPWGRYPDFFRKAGLTGEPMMCFPVTEWVSMLRAYGMLFIGAPWLPGPMGGHVRVLFGVSGDGNDETTRMHILDPWGGREYSERLSYFNSIYEGGAFQNRLVQIGHF